MIESVEVGDFLSHSQTKIDFNDGVTVFVGHNGAGKSSIVDAITFALFGNHTRKTNKGLIRRGASQGYSKIIFSINQKKYQAVRKIDLKGTRSSQFLELKGDEWVPIIEGERRQFGESTTKKIESYIGLNFEKLKIASIVQQGELNSIIKAKPKEFKELINAIIGIDKLDTSSEMMKIILKNFRESIKKEFGYDDTHTDLLKNELIKYQKEIQDSIPLKQKMLSKKEKHQTDITQLKNQIENELPKKDKLSQLESRRTELVEYAKEAIASMQEEIDEKEQKIHDCEGCFGHLDDKKNIEKRLEMADTSVSQTDTEIQSLKMKIVSINEQISLAEKLKLEDGKCPVCDSKVDHLNPLFQEQHLKEEIALLNKKIKELEKQNVTFEKKKQDFLEKLEDVRDAEATLRVHSIKTIDEINKIKHEITIQKTNIQKIPAIQNTGQLVEVSTIDSHAKLLYEKIIDLENQTKGFDLDSFHDLKKSLDEKQLELSNIDQQLGGILEKIRKGEEQVRKITHTLKELEIVQQYIVNLKSIHENVFNRDGSVATSLRSWALNTISAKTSEYLTMLNTKIQRIDLTEKARDISITCYSKNTTLDLDSLSGGEQVSIALALRLGMAQLLGASNLNFIILDEPTTHLDEERRKSLVKVLTQLSDITNTTTNSAMQFIIITHDAEIFEDSSVEQIYKFESAESGTIVTAL